MEITEVLMRCGTQDLPMIKKRFPDKSEHEGLAARKPRLIRAARCNN